MLTFSSYLLEDKLPRAILCEGGNVQIGDHAAQHINLEDHDRDIVSDVIMKSLVELNHSFKEDTGLYIWKPSVLKDGKIFSGSTKHFFDSRIPTETFVKHKKSVGDIDLMVDENLKKQIIAFISDRKGENFGSLELIGSQQSGDQTITLWKLEPMGINVQVDLEYVEFLKDEPTEWSEFSHSASFEDMEIGIKGAFHKLLMTSLMGHTKADAILQMKTKQKDIKAGTHALSIKGLRKKFEKIGELDGKNVVRETGSKEWNRNFYDILREIFGKEASADEVKMFWSYTGILKLLKKNMAKDDLKKVFEEFIDRLFGEGAQGLYRGDPNRDLDEKMVALKYAKEKLNLDLDEHALHRLQKEFYEKYK
jgi:hypothetical protein